MDDKNHLKKQKKKDQPVLSSKTVEIMLHKWPAWGKSIKGARQLPEMRYPLPDSYEARQEWIKKYGGQAWQYAVKEINRLDLPEHFWSYWLCCVQSDYENDNGTINYDKIKDFHGEKRLKVYPPALYRVVVWGDTNRPGEFSPISAEIHPKFASRSVSNKAMIEMTRVTQFFTKEKHPIESYKESAKGQRRCSQRRADMRMRFQSGESSYGDLLKEEASQLKVQGFVEEIRREFNNNYTRKNVLKKLKRKVYARVRGRLSGLGPFPRVGSKWWPYI